MTEQKQNVSLSSLLTPSKTVTVDYPGMNGFTVDLCYLAREELIKLRNRCLSQKFNRKTRAFDDQLDEDKFLVEKFERGEVPKNQKSLGMVSYKVDYFSKQRFMELYKKHNHTLPVGVQFKYFLNKTLNRISK